MRSGQFIRPLDGNRPDTTIEFFIGSSPMDTQVRINGDTVYITSFDVKLEMAPLDGQTHETRRWRASVRKPWWERIWQSITRVRPRPLQKGPLP